MVGAEAIQCWQEGGEDMLIIDWEYELVKHLFKEIGQGLAKLDRYVQIYF